MDTQIVTPYEVSSTEAINYDKIIDQFGCEKITEVQKNKLFEKIPSGHNKSHLLGRNIYYAHRDLDRVIEDISSTYLYTGRGPSSSTMHLGHSIPFLFNLYLQKTFSMPLLIMISDDEKYFMKDLTFEEIEVNTRNNIRDIISLGFDINKTFIFNNFSYIGKIYPQLCMISKHFKVGTINQTFGFDSTTNVGALNYTAIQGLPCFASNFGNILPYTSSQINETVKCLIPCAIDQDPFFRVLRDVAPKLKSKKPSSIYAKFLPDISGIHTKMSSTSNNKRPGAQNTTAITLMDTEKQVEKKIKKKMFSGSRKTLEEHEKYGADITIDVACHYLKFFMKDDEKYSDILHLYSKGRVNTSYVKGELIKVVNDFLRDYQLRRESITDAEIDEFMKIRKLK